MDYLKCMLVFKCLNNLAPPYLLDEFSRSRDFHSYNTRHRDLLRPPLAKQQNIRAPLGSVVLRSGIPYRWT